MNGITGSRNASKKKQGDSETNNSQLNIMQNPSVVDLSTETPQLAAT